MKKFLLSLMSILIIQSNCMAKDILQFDFPDAGWHKVASPDGIEYKKCYIPQNQTEQNYTEMFVFMEKNIKTPGISPMTILQKQLGKDRNNYKDIFPEYIKQNFDNAMAIWCSEQRSTCAIERAFQGNEGIILVTYINKMPHYSSNIITNKVNIVGSVKLYNNQNTEPKPKNLIEL